MAIVETPTPPPSADQVVWYRAADGDHAFPAGDGWMRSACREIRWTAALQIVEGTVQACMGCLAALTPLPVAPATESEQRAVWGDR